MMMAVNINGLTRPLPQVMHLTEADTNQRAEDRGVQFTNADQGRLSMSNFKSLDLRRVLTFCLARSNES